MGYQNGPRMMTVTADGWPVTFVVNYDEHTVTVKEGDQTLGTFGNRTAAKQALGLVDVPSMGSRGITTYWCHRLEKFVTVPA